MRIWWILILAGCGRMGFDEIEPASFTDAVASTATSCADVDLGSRLGDDVATGTTAGGRNVLEGCRVGDGNEITHAWIAPATGTYQFDTCQSDPLWDAMLYVRNGACDGDMLACSDNGCGGDLLWHGRVTLDLQIGQAIVIVVDAVAPTWDSVYRLAIRRL